MEESIKESNSLQMYEEAKTEFEKHACRIDDEVCVFFKPFTLYCDLTIHYPILCSLFQLSCNLFDSNAFSNKTITPSY